MKFTLWIETDAGLELELIAECDYTSGQKEILYPNDSAQPGCPAELELCSLTLADPKYPLVQQDVTLKYQDNVTQDMLWDAFERVRPDPDDYQERD